MTSKGKKKIALLFWVMLNIIIVLGISFMFLQIERKTQEYTKEKNEFSLLQGKIRSFHGRKTIFESEKKEISIINNAFLKQEAEEGIRLASFISDFEKIALTHKVSIETQGITQPTQDTPFYIFNFKFSGKFPDILKLFFAIENTPLKEYKLMSIQKINIKRTTMSLCSAGQEGESCTAKKIGAEGEFSLKVYTGVPKKDNSSSQQQTSSPTPATTSSPTQSP